MKKAPKIYSQKQIISLSGAVLLLISLLLFIAPMTFLKSISYAFICLFGLGSFYFFYPLIFAAGTLLVFNNFLKKEWRGIAFYSGLIIFFLAFLILLTDFGLGGSESFSNFGSYIAGVSESYQDLSTSYIQAHTFGGGILGYFLASLLSFGGRSVTLLVGFLLLLLGLVLIFLPLIKFIVNKIKVTTGHNRAIRESEQAVEEQRVHYETKREEPVDNSLYERPTLVNSSSVTERRTEIYKDDIPRPIFPEEKTTPDIVRQNWVKPEVTPVSGLHEAVFSFNKKPAKPKVEVSIPKVEEKKEEPLPFNNSLEALEQEEQKKETVVPSVEPVTPIVEQKKEETVIPSIPPVMEELHPSMDEIKPVMEEEKVEPILEKQEPEPAMNLKAPSFTSPTLNPVQSQPIPQAKEEKPLLHPLHNLGVRYRLKKLPFTLPPVSLLKTYEGLEVTPEMIEECQARTNIINETLSNLGVKATVTGFTIGPAVTRYDIQPDKSTSVASIGRFVNDISMRLGGLSARYEEVVRGKQTAGLEIPNTKTTTVPFKDVFEALPPLNGRNSLYVPFGKNISGEVMAGDLASFPHMLVAGTSGSGKSVFMHGILMTLLMRNTPDDLRLILVDPKRSEMSKYREVPHLLCPIITEPSDAKVALQKLVDRMEERYTIFEQCGVRDIQEFNLEYAEDEGLEKLPYIVMVIDEYADLSNACKDISSLLVRIAQKARAAGIHLIIATQRPSVDVITGVIKANFNVRVALAMKSATDSITILGQAGAENLVGHGDMLVDCPEVVRNALIRCQGCYVDGREMREVSNFLRNERKPDYDPAFLDLTDHEAMEMQAALNAAAHKTEIKAQQNADFYDSVVEQVLMEEYTSISKIQRQFSVGFPRAGKLFAQLQNEGIVASAPESASSSKGCKVLVHTMDEVMALRARKKSEELENNGSGD